MVKGPLVNRKSLSDVRMDTKYFCAYINTMHSTAAAGIWVRDCSDIFGSYKYLGFT